MEKTDVNPIIGNNILLANKNGTIELVKVISKGTDYVNVQSVGSKSYRRVPNNAKAQKFFHSAREAEKWIRGIDE